MYCLDIQSRTEQLLSLSGEWNALATADSEATVFQRAEWIFSWLRHLMADRVSRIFVYRAADQLAAIFPMCIRVFDGLRVLEFIGARGTDYLSPIVGFGRDQLYRAFFQDVQSEPIDVISFEDIPEGHSLVRYCQEAKPHKAVRLNTTCLCFVISSGDSWPVYLQTVSYRKQRDIAYDRRYFKRNCATSDIVFEAPSQLLDLHMQLHQARQRKQGHIGAYATIEAQAFFHDVTMFWEKEGLLRLSFLYSDTQPIASILAAEWRNRTFALTFGMNPARAHLSPGSLLLGFCIEDSIKRGSSTYDLSRGAEPYKLGWGAHACPNVHLVLSDSWEKLTAYDEARRRHFSGLHFAPSSR